MVQAADPQAIGLRQASVAGGQLLLSMTSGATQVCQDTAAEAREGGELASSPASAGCDSARAAEKRIMLFIGNLGEGDLEGFIVVFRRN